MKMICYDSQKFKVERQGKGCIEKTGQQRYSRNEDAL